MLEVEFTVTLETSNKGEVGGGADATKVVIPFMLLRRASGVAATVSDWICT